MVSGMVLERRGPGDVHRGTADDLLASIAGERFSYSCARGMSGNKGSLASFTRELTDSSGAFLSEKEDMDGASWMLGGWLLAEDGVQRVQVKKGRGRI